MFINNILKIIIAQRPFLMDSNLRPFSWHIKTLASIFLYSFQHFHWPYRQQLELF